MTTELQLRTMLIDIVKELKDVGLKPAPISSIKFTDQTRSWGVCHHSINTNDYTITISRFLSKDGTPNNTIRSIIAHEVLHTCPGCFNHGVKFQEGATILKEKYSYKINAHDAEELGMESIMDDDNNYKYVIKCKDCGQAYRYVRRPKWINRLSQCSCGVCHQKSLSITKQPA